MTVEEMASAGDTVSRVATVTLRELSAAESSEA
jgi:hypothetical protein